MRAVLMLGITMALAPKLVFAQSVVGTQTTTAPPGARFEVVQSGLAARWTFRLDRYCGRVHQLVKTKDDDVAWDPMQVVGLPACSTDGRPYYQIFTSGLAARHTFLINTITGRSWVLLDQEGTPIWSPFDE